MSTATTSSDAIMLLKADHKEVESLFKKCERYMKSEQPSYELRDLCQQIIQALTLHASIEEQIFYPAMKQALPDGKIIFEAFEEHHVVKVLLAELQKMRALDARFYAKLTVLMEMVRHHVQEEEGELFPECRERCGRKLMRDIGATMMSYKKQLMADQNLQPATAPARPAEQSKIQAVIEMSGARH